MVDDAIWSVPGVPCSTGTDSRSNGSPLGDVDKDGNERGVDDRSAPKRIFMSGNTPELLLVTVCGANMRF